MSESGGSVYSFTTIRVAGNAHAAETPFTLLLVDCDDGVRRLGRWTGDEPPPIGRRVLEQPSNDPYPAFGA
jgi:uncharacterized OB-fold protein